MRLIAIGAAALLAGCAAYESYDRVELTDFDVNPGKSVEMRVQVSQLSDWGEEARLRWLDEFVTGNGVCANGYAVEGPDIFKIKEWAVDVDLYQYTARCV